MGNELGHEGGTLRSPQSCSCRIAGVNTGPPVTHSSLAQMTWVQHTFDHRALPSLPPFCLLTAGPSIRTHLTSNRVSPSISIHIASINTDWCALFKANWTIAGETNSKRKQELIFGCWTKLFIANFKRILLVKRLRVHLKLFDLETPSEFPNGLPKTI